MRKSKDWSRCALVATLVLSGCTALPDSSTAMESPDASRPDGSRVYLIVRHAEKQTAPPDDPELTVAGRSRAQQLADDLADAPVIAVYATDYRRTRETAAATANAHGLPITGYDAKQPAVEFAAGLRRLHVPGTVLVVGHSNTVPAIAAALCRCEVMPMDEQEYDRRLWVEITADGRTTLETVRDQ